MKHSLLICLLLINSLGCTEGQIFRNRATYSSEQIPSSAYGQRNDDRSEMYKLNMALANIINAYVDTVNAKKLVEDAIVGMLEKLDPHSNYMTPEEVKEMNEPLQGNFDGIGIQFNMLTDTLNVVQVIPGGPSEKVGIMVGDKILYVNDTIIAGVKMKNTDIMSRLRGQKGTTVTIKVQRNRNPELLTFKIVRDKIPIYSVDASYMINKETGYIKINRFAATTYEEFAKAMDKLQEQGMQNLILDLQGNGGGYLGTAIQIANEFLARGSLIVYTEGVHKPREDLNSLSQGAFEKGRLVLLVDESSASASEIVSGAIQDWDRGIIVGRRTFGKGLVQRPIELPDGSMIRLTTARYYTPTGRSIQKHYENGNLADYNRELINRYNRGELLSADSIHFPDSLKYSTLRTKRTVYGGGGIMPDYFVPLDTMYNTRLMREMSAYGIVYKFVQNHLDDNRKKYKNRFSTFPNYYAEFETSDAMVASLLSLYKTEKKRIVEEAESKTGAKDDKSNVSRTDEIDEDGIETPANEAPADGKYLTDSQINEQMLRSGKLIRAQIKALIARDLFGENEYYQVINTQVNAYNEAIRLIGNKKDYEQLLK